MRILLLGPVELIGPDGQVAGISAAKRRTVLAALALELNKVVSADRLMNVAWDDNPPPTARAALQGHIAQLRKVLGGGVELVTRAPGYQLVADRSLVDVTRFDDLITRARSAPDGVELLRSALALWRGPALADVPASRLREQATAWLDEARLAALQDLGERLLQLGRADEVIAGLRDAVQRCPTREPLVELLMRGLFETGRHAEALRLFHHTRTALADELGVDPGGNLQQTYQMVLAGTENTGTIGHATAAPAQLPRQNRGLVGRDTQLAALVKGLRGPDPAIRVLTGPAGVGKTTLAVHCAHALAGDMPDGQLFVDLKGFDDGDPVDPGVALTGFLRALGVADARIPACVTERSALYRSLLADRRMLVLLDNALTAEQVRPLLPGTSSCVVLVTSRHRLDDLTATEGAEPLPLDVLAPHDAVAVLGLLVDKDRIAADPLAAAELAELCDRLPLALRLVAARLAASPLWTIRDMVTEVSERRPRGVSQSVGLSYRKLRPSTARLFRLLDQYSGDDIDQYAAAALSATGTSEARSNLDSLAALHLLHESGRDRYRRRDLVRLVMAELAAEEPAEQREAAMVRLIDYYVQTAEHACRLLSDHIWSPDSAVEYPADEIPPMSTTQHAMRWFTAESANLHRVLNTAVQHGYRERTWRLALCLARFYFRHGDPARQFEVCGTGLTAAEGNHEAQAIFLMTVGTILVKSGQAEDALPYCQAATRLSRAHLHTQGAVLACLGYCYRSLGRLDEADAVLQSAVDIARQSGDVVLETYALIGNANVQLERGRVREALRVARQATDLYASHKVSTVYALALHAAGSAMYALGRPHGALMLLYQGHALANDIGDRHLDALYHREIGNVMAHLGGEQAARPHWAQADRLYDEIRLVDVPHLTTRAS